MRGVDFNEEMQRSLLNEFVADYKNEYDQFPRKMLDSPPSFFLDNGYFESVDAEILHSMLRKFKPEKMIDSFST